MKTAIKLTTGILAVAIMAGGNLVSQAAAQDTDAIDNARSIAKSLQQKQANDTNAALNAAGVGNPSKPAPGAPSQASPAARAATPAPAAKPASTPKSTAASNQLQRVNVVQSADGVRVEMIASQSVTPRVSKLASPARVLVELPETISASPQNKIAFGNAGVKGVRIGTDGKTPPTTSVVVDLDKACTYELAPGANGKLVLNLHTQAVAKSAPANVSKPAAQPQATAKNAAPAPKAQPAPQPQLIAKSPAPTAKLQTASHPVASAKSPAPAAAQPPSAKPVSSSMPVVVAKATAQPAPKPSKDSKDSKAVAKPAQAKTEAKAEAKKEAKKEAKTEAKTEAAPDASKTADAFKPKLEDKKAEPKPEDKKWAMSGKRDPFFSPVVQQQGGSGCTTGKKCLEIGNINLRGVVKSDNGFIAVVTNSLNKAYFLRENDPVFNGYVMKITGDSVVFSETVQDKLGKSFTREVVKKIFTPAV